MLIQKELQPGCCVIRYRRNLMKLIRCVKHANMSKHGSFQHPWLQTPNRQVPSYHSICPQGRVHLTWSNVNKINSGNIPNSKRITLKNETRCPKRSLQIPGQLLEARDFPKLQGHDLSLPKLPSATQCSKVEDQTIDDIKTDDRIRTSSQKPSGEHLPASIQTFNGLMRHPVTHFTKDSLLSLIVQLLFIPILLLACLLFWYHFNA